MHEIAVAYMFVYLLNLEHPRVLRELAKREQVSVRIVSQDAGGQSLICVHARGAESNVGTFVDRAKRLRNFRGSCHLQTDESSMGTALTGANTSASIPFSPYYLWCEIPRTRAAEDRVLTILEDLGCDIFSKSELLGLGSDGQPCKFLQVDFTTFGYPSPAELEAKIMGVGIAWPLSVTDKPLSDGAEDGDSGLKVVAYD